MIAAASREVEGLGDGRRVDSCDTISRLAVETYSGDGLTVNMEHGCRGRFIAVSQKGARHRSDSGEHLGIAG